nr:hypothetical protein [Paenibacillus sp. S150]
MSEQSFKQFIEMSQVAKTGFQRDIKHAPVGMQQQILGILQFNAV